MHTDWRLPFAAIPFLLLACLQCARTQDESLLSLVSPIPEQRFSQAETLIAWELREPLPPTMVVGVYIDGMLFHNGTVTENSISAKGTLFTGSHKPGKLAVGRHRVAVSLQDRRAPALQQAPSESDVQFVLAWSDPETTWPAAPPIGTMAGLADEDKTHVSEIQRLVQHPPSFPTEKYPENRGIVICAGGKDLFFNAMLTVRALRHFGCELPIEVFYQGGDELTAESAAALAEHNVLCVDTNWFPELSSQPLRGWQMKAAALIHSSFVEVLMIDADNIPAADPTDLFESPSYQRHGNLYWRDFSVDPHWIKPHVFAMFGVTMVAGEPELEAGQVLIHKERCWPALVIYEYLNRHFLYFYLRMYGDKDTHRLAFKVTGQEFTVVKWHPESMGSFIPALVGERFCGDTMVHLHPETGRPAFLHRTLSDYAVGQKSVRRAHSKPELTWRNVTRGYIGWDVRTVPVQTGDLSIDQWCVIVSSDTRLVPAPKPLQQLETLSSQWAQELASQEWLYELPDDAKNRG